MNGQASNPLPFTVAPGNVYFVATSGSDNNSGAFAAPWCILVKARGAMLPGDITYAMDGVTQSTDDGTGWDAAFLGFLAAAREIGVRRRVCRER